MKKQTSLHINGKRYDALTGNLLEQPIVPRRPSKSIDGVMGPTTAVARPKTAATSKVKPLPASQVPRAKAAHAVIKRTTASTTLMRKAVAKPTAASLKRRSKVQTPLTRQTAITHTTTTILPKHAVHAVNTSRAHRATAVAISPRIAKFAHELAVETNAALDSLEKKLEAEPATNYQPTVVRVAAGSSADIFEQALLKATAHEQVAPIIGKSKRARSLREQMAAFALLAIMVVAILGILSYNSGSARFERQTRGAGFSAVVPAYTPTGFARGQVQTADGLVSLQYVRSGAVNGANSFAVTQKATDLTSDSLVNKLITANNTPTYSAIKTPTTTVFVYGRNQAAWIYNGVLYQVLGNGLLSTSDFTQLASSL